MQASSSLGVKLPNVGSSICNSTGDTSDEENDESEEEELTGASDQPEDSDDESPEPACRQPRGLCFSFNLNEEAC